MNYKSILAPAFVGITDKPFISSFISEAEQIRKLLFQNGAWTESLQAKVNGNVRSVAQTLSDAEKAQARTNIGAQAELVSGTHIKTVNGKSLVGSGNVTVSGDGGGVVLLDFTDGDTISLTEEQIADISDDSVTVIAVRDGGRHICTGRSESGAYLYFLDYMVMVKTDTMTASIENVLHDSIGQSQSSLCHVPGESLSIDNNYRSEILCTGNTVKITSMPAGFCVFRLNVTGSAVLPAPDGFSYVFTGMDTPSDMTDGVTLEAGCYKVICWRFPAAGGTRPRYHIFKPP